MEVVLDGESGRRLVLRDLEEGEDEQRFTATLSMPDGEATLTVWDYKTGLPAFMRELASGWRGGSFGYHFAGPITEGVEPVGLDR